LKAAWRRAQNLRGARRGEQQLRSEGSYFPSKAAFFQMARSLRELCSQQVDGMSVSPGNTGKNGKTANQQEEN
jgi:hypothetical protein